MPKANVNASFSAITSAARSAAREERLIVAVNRVEADSYLETQRFNGESATLTKEIEALEKEAKIVEFAASSASTEDPEYQDLQENAVAIRKEVDYDKSELQKELDAITTAHSKAQDDFKAKIADLEAGKISVNYDKVIVRSKELIKAKVASQFLAGDFDSSTE